MKTCISWLRAISRDPAFVPCIVKPFPSDAPKADKFNYKLVTKIDMFDMITRKIVL